MSAGSAAAMPANAAFLAALRRRAWAGGVVATLVVLLAGGVYLLALRHVAYVATQALDVSVLPPDGGGGAAALEAQQLADQTARNLAGGAVFTAAAFDAAVVGAIHSSGGALDTRFGASTAASLVGLNAAGVAGALSGAHVGDRVLVSARWPTPGGARALATAAGQVLSGDPDLAFGGAADSLSLDGATGRLPLDGTVSVAARDPAQQAAARTRLLWSLLLGLAAALAFTLLLAWWDVRTLARSGAGGLAAPRGLHPPDDAHSAAGA